MTVLKADIGPVPLARHVHYNPSIIWTIILNIFSLSFISQISNLFEWPVTYIKQLNDLLSLYIYIDLKFSLFF